MRVLIKKLDQNAVVPFKTHDSDFCYDVVATSRKQVADNVFEYGIGLAFEIVRETIVIGEWKEKIGVTVTGVNDDGTCDCEDSILQSSVVIPDKCFNKVKLSIDFRPRSSIYKTGLILSNCCGTIDELYRGEVKAFFYKVAPGKIYEVGDRIGQIKLGITLPLKFEVVDELSDTERGAGGFGSTGK